MRASRWPPSVPTVLLGLLAVAALLLPADQSEGISLAYVGPGAGFAFMGSLLGMISAILMTVLSIVVWPARLLWNLLRRRQGYRKARVRKLIFLGLDGLDPVLTERFMAEGKLPNLAALREQGGYRRLRTTFPALSPVAWSTFATGVNPARHNIFDFLSRNLKSYLPELSSSRVSGPTRFIGLGRYRIPLSNPLVELRRKSTTFWKLLGDQGIASTILRVPITFPPEQFNGRLLSAMCTPDLLGTQGSFTQFTTRVAEATFENGSRYPLRRQGHGFQGVLCGPPNSLRDGAAALEIPFSLAPGDKPGHYTLHLCGAAHPMRAGEHSPWLKLAFHAAPGINVHGIARFLITETAPEFSLYVTPINIDPESPALPISHPSYYSSYLAKLLGDYATVGMAEDTWALNEGVIDEDAFLAQAWSIQAERESMFFSALDRTRQGVVACVFDTSDRVQHMFFRHLDGRSPAGPHTGVIEDLYRRMDALVGRTMQHVDSSTALFVLSDHGFRSFRRGVNLNAWLRDNGYLVMKDGPDGAAGYLRGIDWSRTRAYTFGLAGLYLNLKGRESQGLVQPGPEAAALRQELIEKLTGLPDPQTGETAIRAMYATGELYRGPYLDAAPDLIVGFEDGYRSSWDAALGKTSREVFTDNPKAWSGDHCIDPLLVPGILFSNRPIESLDPGIEDMAPTALALFGVDQPAWMEGRPVFPAAPAEARA
ncbi:MAG: alkaline phosphatase family protein [Bryobacterales bacterium]|nr:alkaline phosphatase family protein [Bryobacterales bacterium]